MAFGAASPVDGATGVKCSTSDNCTFGNLWQIATSELQVSWGCEAVGRKPQLDAGRLKALIFF